MPVRADEWMGTNGFVWFVGIVEDRSDPLKIGRVRVRCFGWHSNDKAALPTASLPWAQVMVPTTSASTSGVGSSPTGLTEGSWVIGFFMDGRRAQTPMIMGSFHGVAGDAANPNEGFGDPNGVYPVVSGIPDTSPMAAGGNSYVDTAIVQDRISTKVKNVPEAAIQKITSVAYDADDATYETPTWNQPDLHAETNPPLYPYNHVRTTESGHLFEIDDTNGARRIHEYHASGTNREIMNDGTTVTRIVGDDYQIVVKDKKVIIFGSCSVTIAGDARLRIDGDMVHEVLGDYHLHVKGSMKSKIEGNQETEIIGSSVTQINSNDSKSIGGNRVRNVGGEVSENFASVHRYTIGGDVTQIIGGSKLTTVASKITQVSGGDLNMGSGGATSIAGKSSFTSGSPGPTTIKGSRIDLNPP
jgi:hypothetical protein